MPTRTLTEALCTFGREHTKAIPDFTTAIELNSKYAMAYFYRGLANGMAGRRSEAKKDLQKAADLDATLRERVKKLFDEDMRR